MVGQQQRILPAPASCESDSKQIISGTHASPCRCSHPSARSPRTSQGWIRDNIHRAMGAAALALA
jgi:hypothetical protein